ncbi:MAG: hypothetical protein VX874_00205 [Pseudomonadota bacterium]|nr:hypothetical protein [Pseudomonadota bacterium]
MNHDRNDDLVRAFPGRTAVFDIFGSGNVGQPLAFLFAEIVHKVLASDIDQQRVDVLNAGRSGSKHIDGRRVVAAVEGGFDATTDFARITEADKIMVCVSAPLKKYCERDTSFVAGTYDLIRPHARLIIDRRGAFRGPSDHGVCP